MIVPEGSPSPRAPETTEPVSGAPPAVVVVPVLGRPHRAQPLVDSLRSTSDVPLVFVCSPDDKEQQKACRRTGERVIIATWVADRGDFAKKTNLAFRETTEPWVFCGADDLLFHQGWLKAAIAEGERTGAGVVGTQDNGNPMVRRGRHATHSLVRRSYAESPGGTFDGTGEIYSEEYDHQFVDNELVDTARQRRMWAFAADSVVEHLHPHWNKGVEDATYEKALRDTAGDRMLYARRMTMMRRGVRPARHRRASTL